MGKKKEQKTIDITKEFCLAYAAQNLMEASRVAQQQNDTEGMLASSSLWLELSSRLENDEEAASHKFGFHHEKDKHD